MNIPIFSLPARHGASLARVCVFLILPAALIACDDDDGRPDPATAPSISDAPGQVFTAYEPASAHFSNTGGRATGCAVSPNLPSGLRVSLDTNELLPTSCVITGVPTERSPEASYTVTVANGVGSDAATVSLAVDFPPPDLPDLDNQRLTIGANVSMDLINTGGWIPASGGECSVSPDLPAGLSAARTPQGSCRISGAPMAASEEQTYTVTATNPGGSGSGLVAITTSAVSLPVQDTVVWEDQFDGSTLNPDNWDVQTGDGCPQNCGWGNNELQSYTNSSANLRVAGGNLEIIATDRPAANMPYGSARIRTSGKRNFRYPHGGTLRVEASMKLPGGSGLWPAFWMLPEDNAYGVWPRSGEIDIVEAVNLGTSLPPKPPRTKTSGTVHYGAPWPFQEMSGSDSDNAMDPMANFNEYAIEWEAGEIRWYVNDEHRYTQTGEQWYTLSARDELPRILKNGAPFDQPFHLLLNVAVGGRLPEQAAKDDGITLPGGAPDANTRFPQTMTVEYVRVLNCGSDRSQSSCYKVSPDVVANSVRVSTGTDGSVHRVDVFTHGLQTFMQGRGSGRYVSSTDGDGVTVDTGAVAGADRVMELSFTAPGSAAMLSARLDNEEEGAAPLAFDINGAERTQMGFAGRVPVLLEFDLALTELAGSQSGLEVRIVDENGNYLSQPYPATKLQEIMALGSGGQKQILDLSEMTASGDFDQKRVTVLFSLISTGSFDASARILAQVDDIRFHIPCPASLPGASSCGRGPVAPPPIELDVTEDASVKAQDVYIDGLVEDSGFDQLFMLGSMATEVDVEGRGKVIQCTSASSQVVCGISATSPADLSAYDYIELDLRVITPPTNAGADFMFKYEADGLFMAEIVLGNMARFTTGGAWRRIRSDITSAYWQQGGVPYDLTKVTLVGAFPRWEQAAGAVWQIDNIRLYDLSP